MFRLQNKHYIITSCTRDASPLKGKIEKRRRHNQDKKMKIVMFLFVPFNVVFALRSFESIIKLFYGDFL